MLIFASVGVVLRVSAPSGANTAECSRLLISGSVSDTGARPPVPPDLAVPRRAQEMLDTWERASTDEVIERVESKGGDVRAKLRRAGALTFSRWLLPIDLAVRDWARHEQAVAERLRCGDNRRMDYLRSLFGVFCTDADDVEARSMLAFSLLIGSHFMAADHGGRPRADVLELALSRLLA